MRVKHGIKSNEPWDVSLQCLLDLTEGMSVLSLKRTRLLALFKRILIEIKPENVHMHLLCHNHRLALQTVMLF